MRFVWIQKCQRGALGFTFPRIGVERPIRSAVGFVIGGGFIGWVRTYPPPVATYTAEMAVAAKDMETTDAA